MRKLKQIFALILAVTMLFTMDGVNIQAAEIGTQDISDSSTEENTVLESTEVEVTEETTEIADTENQTTEVTDTADTADQTTETAEMADTEDQTTEITDIANTENQTTETVDTADTADQVSDETDVLKQKIQNNMLLSYMVVGSSYVETPGTQYVLAGIGDGTYTMDAATLHYMNTETKQEYTVEADSDTIDEDSALFYMDFADESYKGSYEVTTIDYVVAGNTYTIDVTKTDVDATFGVDQEVETNPDAVTVSKEEQEAEEGQDTEDAVVMTDANGNVMSESDLAAAIESASEGISDNGDVSSTGSGNLVIVLDPGHGGTDPGACATVNGISYNERDLVLKIAGYCKTELETYSGVTVYMTRTDNTSTLMNRQQRALYAKSCGADVLISFHLNSTTDTYTTAAGAEIYVNISDGTASEHTVGTALGNEILKKLSDLGLETDRGIKTKAQSNGDDYFGQNYWPKYYGFPGIIIEHAFLNNPEDTVFYLSTDDKLQKLGVADATGIAEYYGLTKRNTTVSLKYVKSKSSTSMYLAWDQLSDVDGYKIYRSTSKNGSYSFVTKIKSASTTTYIDTGLSKGKTYYYKIRAYKGSKNYSYSTVKSTNTIKQTSINHVKSNGSGTLTVNWNAIDKATGYLVYRSTSASGTYTKIATVSSGTTTSYKDTGLSKGKTYYYKVKVCQKQNGKTGYGSASSAVDGWSITQTKISAVNSETDGLQISWKKVSKVYKYQIYRSTSKSGTYQRVATVKSSVTSYTDTTVKSGKKYYYKVRTVNRVDSIAGYGSYSSVKYGTQAKKAAISYVKSTTPTSLKIAWAKVSGASGYKIYRSTSKSGTYKLIKTITSGNTTTYTNKKLKTAKKYYYKVQVTNEVNGYSGVGTSSAVVYGKTVAKTTISYIQSKSSKKLKIAWEKIDGANGYRIARSTSKNGTYTVIKTITSGNTTSYTDSSVKAAKKYYYKIEATNYISKKTGYSGYSNVLAGRTVKSTTISKVQAVATESICLTWVAVSGASGYQVYRSTSSGGTYEKVATISGSATVTYTEDVPKNNTTYYYKIRSYNKNNGKTGYSEWSSIANGKAVAKTTLTLSAGSTGGIVLNWKKVSGASKYAIYRKETKSGTYAKLKTISSGSTITYTDTTATSGKTYYYRIMTYNRKNGVTGKSGYSSSQHYTIKLTEIMGTTGVTVAQMVAYYNASGKTYPTSIYEKKGAENITTFAQIVYDEAKVEGVKAEVVWAQICNETGFLQFGGDVKAEQCNFAGIGATGNGVSGNSFADVRTGIRAQVQHLKCYASTIAKSDYANVVVDPRWGAWVQGKAIYVEWLGIQENPNGSGWAAMANYGYNLISMINIIKSK